MHVRPGKAQDLPDCATISRNAMFDDNLTAYVAPHRHNHPECLRQGILRRAKKRFYGGDTLWVAVTDDNDADWDGHEKVIGHLSASSTREANSKPSAFSWKGLEVRLLQLEELFIWYTNSDRSISRRKWTEFASGKWTGYQDPFANFKEYWHVSHLSVDPEYQRRGVGTALIENVKRLASKDTLPLALLSSVQGRFLYLKSGFRELEQLNEGTLYACHLMAWYPDSSK
ncbi:hypothetical protein PV08_09579 [Exophiala spinifera]|uniref:N-acetyltransferase domain-containing protein n=1 Tax=Exophiala spinifera TaxID=91928 RepID=A0A0D1ZH88_9EURO|nr:uncharacterized protein PV08_09579 [Exophiala spinifera]KIW12302.1 hypothetical protein PV08_09579 [Exophiala spinifera]